MVERAFGSWPSPISAALVAAGGVGVGAPAAVTRDGVREVWWSELRPAESGRVVPVRRVGDGEPEDMLASPWSARTRVHEYGGGAWFLGRHSLYFSHWDDQRLYRLPLDVSDGEPEPLTPQPETPHGWRFADGRESPDGRWLVCVNEDHHPEVVVDNGEAVNSLVAIPTSGGEPSVISERTDFVAAPRFSPDGSWLSWVVWDHPNMPWDGTRLCVAPVWYGDDNGTGHGGLRLGTVKIVAGSEEPEAIHGADWTSDGRLVFSTDRSGCWNLHQWRPGDDNDQALTSITEAEIGTPSWVFGAQQWTELDADTLAVIITTNAVDELATVDREGSVIPVATPFTRFTGLVKAGGGGDHGRTGNPTALTTAASPTALPAVVEIDLDGGAVSTHRPPEPVDVDPAWYSRGEAIDFVSGDRRSHAFFYPPTGPDLAAPAGDRPPLIVIGHGGPTAHTTPDLNLKVQFWTSRGFAVVDVNYGGSTGFGRRYRRLLDDSWGLVDVEDCIAAAQELAATERVDRARMAIRGGSAGGFTVLAALTRSNTFSAGTSLYGVADLEALASDTHKFESRYTDRLVGPYPEAKAIYEERSPINHTDGLSCPLLVLQGSEDEIVPVNQAEAIVAAVAAKGIPHAYLLFEGEQHGFRQAVNIVRSLEAELWFYGRVFGFDPADSIEPVEGAVGL